MKFFKGLSDANSVIVTTNERTNREERDNIEYELEEKLEKKVIVLPYGVHIVGIDMASDYEESKTACIYKFYVNEKLKASCGEKKKDLTYSAVSSMYGEENVVIKKEEYSIDKDTQEIINKLKNVMEVNHE